VRVALLAALVAAAALVGTGCGNERQKAPDVLVPAKPTGIAVVRLSRNGIRFVAPSNWIVRPGEKPLLATVSSGEATVAVWAYQRTEKLPKSGKDLGGARARLISAVKRRDRTARIVGATRIHIGGVPGIELLALEQVGRERRKVRSTHLFHQGFEIVVDAFAPVRSFDVVNRQVFSPLLKTLQVGRPAKTTSKGK
jgi:hypothetical protein